MYIFINLYLKIYIYMGRVSNNQRENIKNFVCSFFIPCAH